MWIVSLILSWKVVKACCKMLKHSSEHRVGHCGKFSKCLKMSEVLSLTKCSRTRVDKCWEVSPTSLLCYYLLLLLFVLSKEHFVLHFKFKIRTEDDRGTVGTCF